jgi:hypothetical protein
MSTENDLYVLLERRQASTIALFVAAPKAISHPSDERTTALDCFQWTHREGRPPATSR